MMERLYNSKYEIRPRIMLLAAYDPARDFSEDQLIAFDFMTVYSHEFVADGHNLHGDNGFKYSEFAARKEAVSDAIKALVRQGWLRVELQNGFRYIATEGGVQRFAQMESSYSQEYKKQLGRILEKFSNYSEDALQKLIRAKAIKED